MSRPAIATGAIAGEAVPVGSNARIATLDILRGFALLGMILAHFHKTMGEGAIAAGTTGPVGVAITMGVAEKDRAVFAFLFGVGFAVMLRNLEAKGLPVVTIFLRRLGALFAIGVVVEILTRFAILREYAWWGVPLLFLRHHSTRALLVIALICAAAFSIRDLVDGGYAIATLGHERAVATELASRHERERVWQITQEAMNAVSYWQAVEARFQHLVQLVFSRTSLTPKVYLALFILGLLAVRHGIFEDPKRHRRLIVAAMILGLVCWGAFWWLLPSIPAGLVTPQIGLRLRSGFGILDEQFLAFTAIGTITLLAAYWPRWGGRLAFLGWVGRMALTNYIVQAAIIDFACAPYGLDLRLSPGGVLLAAALLFGFLTLASWLWLSRFRFGPFEWLWRSFTYWSWQPLTIASCPAGQDARAEQAS